MITYCMQHIFPGNKNEIPIIHEPKRLVQILFKRVANNCDSFSIISINFMSGASFFHTFSKPDEARNVSSQKYVNFYANHSP